jgi:hypothetical protein
MIFHDNYGGDIPFRGYVDIHGDETNCNGHTMVGKSQKEIRMMILSL